jgi:hypothetical protein
VFGFCQKKKLACFGRTGLRVDSTEEDGSEVKYMPSSNQARTETRKCLFVVTPIGILEYNAVSIGIFERTT